MSYIDGFVLPLKKDRVDEYRRIAEQAAAIWKEHGAMEYWECVGDDMSAECGTLSFLQLVGADEDETAVYAWVVFESRQKRDEANEKIMADPRLEQIMNRDNPIIDFQRMAWGGFMPLVGE